MTRRPLASLLALALLPALAPPASAAPLTDVVNVSRRATSQSEAAVAVNPANSNDVVVASNVEFGFGVLVAVSHDAGATWKRTVLGDGDRFGSACCDPTISWDAKGNLFLAWLGYEGKGYPNVVPVVLSTDAGDSWTTNAVLDPPAPATRIRARGPVPFRAPSVVEEEPRGAGALDQPTIVTGAKAVWAVWSQDGWLQAAGARAPALGDVRPFRRAQDIPHTHGCTFGDIAIGPKGEVLQVCQRDVPNTKPPVARLRTNIDRDGFGPKGFSAGAAIARTNVTLFEPIPAQRSRTIDAEAGLAWDTTGGAFDGRVYLIYTDEQPDQSDDTDTYLMTSDNRGGAWTAPVPIATSPRSQFLPRIALDRTTGHLAVGWHDAVGDTGSGPYDTDGAANTDAMYFMTFSADGGVSWTFPFKVSAAPSNAKAAANQIDYGDYTGLAFVGGVAHPAWADNSNSTGDNPDGTLHAFDVYSAAVPEV